VLTVVMAQVVPQDDELLNCSLFQNLAYASSTKVSEADVISALRKADAWHFIKVRVVRPLTLFITSTTT
jgi:ABC-type transport system involved in Fe-S cluster assembly fused permease/ATPase subunit